MGKKHCKICGKQFESVTDKLVDGRKICPFCGGFMDGWQESDKTEENFYWEEDTVLKNANGGKFTIAAYGAETYETDELLLKNHICIQLQNGKPYMYLNVYDHKEEGTYDTGGNYVRSVYKIKEVEKSNIRFAKISMPKLFSCGKVTIVFNENGKENKFEITDLYNKRNVEKLKKILLENGIAVEK